MSEIQTVKCINCGTENNFDGSSDNKLFCKECGKDLSKYVVVDEDNQKFGFIWKILRMVFIIFPIFIALPIFISIFSIGCIMQNNNDTNSFIVFTYFTLITIPVLMAFTNILLLCKFSTLENKINKLIERNK